MNICILNGSYEESDAPTKDFDPLPDPTPYLPGHHCEQHLIHKMTAVRQVRDLVRQGFDLFINLCDGAWDEDRPGVEVVQALERYGAAFTGAGAEFYEPTREMMKFVCHYWDIKTPAYIFVTDTGKLEIATQHLRFPLIVKHPNSYNSIGLTQASRVETLEQLYHQASITIENFGGALIEEFIEGREFTALVVENPDDEQNPLAYMPVEFCFPAGESFKHFKLKWIDYQGMTCIPCTDPALSTRLQEMSKKLFIGLNGNGYGRCDIRMNAQGELFMLEINPNCSIFYPTQEAGSADFILLQQLGGHKDFVGKMIQAALNRKRKQNPKWKVFLHPDSGFGMVAIEAIAAGEVIVAYEEKAHYLVSKTHVLQHWDATKQGWFAQYAYPITEEIWATWSDKPGDWKPINHSCDPNAWLQGLDMVARRPIAHGEPITMDYATFCSDVMQPFACDCGAPDCRGLIQATDCMTRCIERYGDHISDYVRTKRQQVTGQTNQHFLSSGYKEHFPLIIE